MTNIPSRSPVSTATPAIRSGRGDGAGELQALPRQSQRAVERCTRWLETQQDVAGYWCGELEGDTILESEYILLLAWLGQQDSPVARQAAQYILQKQQPNGGWSLYPGGGVDVNGSVKAYFALKLTGHNPDDEPMQRARQAILTHGGADAVNSFTRFYLALLGQISYEHCPAVPPEVALLPTWLPVNIYRVSAWSRTILVPLSIMWAYRPVRELPEELSIQELMLRPPDQWPPLRCPGHAESNRWLSWEHFFRRTDALLKWMDERQIRPLRQRGVAQAKRWMLDRFADSDGLGAIFPPIVWSVVALKCLGYTDSSPEVRSCLEQLDAFMIADRDEHGQTTVRLQPCQSPVWDTALCVRALTATGDDAHRASVWPAVSWLLEKEVRCRGDWAHNVHAEPSGWFFEHRNAFYPDVDDTAMVLMALRDARRAAAYAVAGAALPNGSAAETDDRVTMQRLDEACRRGTNWLLAMQNRDGGWGAFDKDNTAEFLCYVPFADHNAMIDPSTPDITARVLEALASCGLRVGHPAVNRAVRYLMTTQEPDGSWFGRWGVNYIYGTWQTLVGLTSVGIATETDAIQRGAGWLLDHQQASGGWGESADSYEDCQHRGWGPPTASQTAWAMLGLIATGMTRHPAVRRGVEFLVQRQTTEGDWEEQEFTGTGFPRVFYLRYHLYPVYFPLLALKHWLSEAGCVESMAIETGEVAG